MVVVCSVAMAAACTTRVPSLIMPTRSKNQIFSSADLCGRPRFVQPDIVICRRCSVSLGSLDKLSGSSSARLRNVSAKRSRKGRNGRIAEAVEDVTARKDGDTEEPDDMFMGRKLQGLEPDFWEGEQWDAFGFVIQYLWAFGVLVALVGCGVAVASYNQGATDIRETDVFKEALEIQAEAPLDSQTDNSQDLPILTD